MGIFNTKMPDLLSLPLKAPAPMQVPQNFNLRSLSVAMPDLLSKPIMAPTRSNRESLHTEMPGMPETLSAPVQDVDKIQYLKRAGQNLVGMDDGKWSRSEQRDFRKNAGMSKQDFRNWKAKLLLGDAYQEGMNYSRGDIRGLEKGYSDLDLTNMYAKLYLNKFASDYDLAHPLQREIQPLEIIEEEPVEEEPMTPYQVQYDLTSNNGMNNYWANQAQQVLGNLSPELLMEISGNDGTIDYNDALAWLQQIGAGNDGKFGEGTIAAFNKRYNKNILPEYVNPVNKNKQIAVLPTNVENTTSSNIKPKTREINIKPKKGFWEIFAEALGDNVKYKK